MNEIKIVRKKVKHSYIKVKPDATVEVIIPQEASDDYVNSLLSRRKKWISDQIELIRKNQVVYIEKKYISGECIRYLGKNYRLKVHSVEEKRVQFQKGYIHLYCSPKSTVDEKKKILENWLKEKAKEKINKIIGKYKNKIEVNFIIKFRAMKTRWGSCNTSKKTLLFNWRLIEKSSYGIEYVVVHELTHLKYPNHDRKFYTNLSVQLPDWEERKNSLYK